MHVALQQGRPLQASPRQGIREPGRVQAHSDARGSVSGALKASPLLNHALLALLGCTSWSHLWVSLVLAQGQPCLQCRQDGERWPALPDCFP